MNIECRRPIRREGSEIKSDVGKIGLIPESQQQLSEENNLEEDYNNTTNNNSESPKPSRVRRNKENISQERTESPIRRKNVKSNPKKQALEVSANKTSSKFFRLPVGLGIVILLFSLLFFQGVILNSSSKELGNKCAFDELKNRYPNESAKVWKILKSGIDDILTGRSNKPSVTLFMHNGGKKAKELIRDIANTSSNCLDSSKEPMEFKSADFKSDIAVNDYGVIVDKYKKTAREGNVVMIANLNEIPAEAARALHSICDRETPIFRKVVILLSLTAEYNGERDIDIAENALNALWKGRILEHELGPLMARVTDEVILLKSR